VHVDTDFGGDPDDACALAMLLGWPDVEITGVTTNLDSDGGRAGCVRYVLSLVGRNDIVVAAGARESLTTRQRYAPTLGDSRHWPATVRPAPSPDGAALALLADSIRRGATILAIGGLTNLAQLESQKPGSLAGARVIVMGGWIAPPASGFPQWGPDMDFNIQCDTRAAEIVTAVADVTLVMLSVAIAAQLRGVHLPRLRTMGELGALLADQSEAHRDDSGFAELAKAHTGLADDLVNFHWDPVAAAVALNWSGAKIQPMRLRTQTTNGVLHFAERPDGRMMQVVVDIDSDDLAQMWLSSIAAI
jgi:purine nucleosidase